MSGSVLFASALRNPMGMQTRTLQVVATYPPYPSSSTVGRLSLNSRASQRCGPERPARPCGSRREAACPGRQRFRRQPMDIPMSQDWPLRHQCSPEPQPSFPETGTWPSRWSGRQIVAGNNYSREVLLMSTIPLPSPIPASSEVRTNRCRSRGVRFGIGTLSTYCQQNSRKGPARGRAFPGSSLGVWLDGSHARRTRTLLALSDSKLDLLAFIERGIALGLDLRVMDEQIFAALVRSDEAESL